MWDSSISMDWESAVSTASSDTGISEYLIASDGSDNKFIFIRKLDGSITFEYKPVQHLYSSSGFYSAGTAVLKNLEPGEWTKLMSVYQYAKANAQSSVGRLMGSFFLQYESGTISDSFNTGMSATLNEQLTTIFQAYRK